MHDIDTHMSVRLLGYIHKNTHKHTSHLGTKISLFMNLLTLASTVENISEPAAKKRVTDSPAPNKTF